MSLVRLPITTLIGGVSRQPADKRFPNQVEEADNVIITVDHGIEKRPGSVLIPGQTWDSVALEWDETTTKELDITDPDQDKFFHWMLRDNEQRLLLVIGYDPLCETVASFHIFDLEGKKHLCTTPSADIVTYLGTDPNNLVAVTIADGTLIVNKDIQVQMDTSTVDWFNMNEAAFNALGYTRGTDPFKRNRYEDLPNNDDGALGDVGVNNYRTVFFVKEDTPGFPSGIYIANPANQPTGSPTFASPPWERGRTGDTESLFKTASPNTMPVRMDITVASDGSDRYQGDFSIVDYQARLSGDTETNPKPSFAGGYITDITFFLNRLVLVSGENVIMSEEGNFFNFWLNNFAEVVDSDLIDITCSLNKVTNIDYAIPWQKTLVLFTNNSQQFEVSSKGALSPLDVQNNPSTAYASVDYVRPVVLDAQLYFVAKKEDSAQVLEYKFVFDANSNQAEDISIHALSYIPSDVKLITESSNHQVLFFITDSEPSTIHCYKMHWTGTQRILSAWYRWNISSNKTILSMKCVEDSLYVVYRLDDPESPKIYMERFSMIRPEPVENMPVELAADGQVLVTGEWDEVTNTTEFDLGFIDDSYDTIVLGGLFESDRAGSSLGGIENNSDDGARTSTILTVPGKYSETIDGEDAACYLCRSYDMDIKLSPQFVRDRNGNAVISGRFQLIKLRLEYNRTAYFTVENRLSAGRNTKVKTYSGLVAGVDNMGINLKSGEFTVPILTRARDADIHIINSSPYPSNFTQLEVFGDYITEME